MNVDHQLASESRDDDRLVILWSTKLSKGLLVKGILYIPFERRGEKKRELYWVNLQCFYMEPAELFIGASLGALFGELLKGILEVCERIAHFDNVLENIKFNVKFLSYVIEQLDEFSDFDWAANTNNLKEQLSKGKELILKCDSVKNSGVLIRYPKATSYTKKLRNFDAALHRASHFLMLQLVVQQLKKQGQRCTLHSILSKIKEKLRTKFLGTIDRRCCVNQHDFALQFQFYDNNQLNDDVGRGLEERIKVVGVDRYKRIFHQTFPTMAAGEELRHRFRCDHLSTPSPLPLKGVVYVSTHKLAFCTKKRIHTNAKMESLYLKIIIPLKLIKGVIEVNPCMKVTCVDDQVFQFTKLAKKLGLIQVSITDVTRALDALL